MSFRASSSASSFDETLKIGPRRFLAQLLDRFDERGRPWSRRGEVLETAHNHHVAHVWFFPQTAERGEDRRVRVASLPLRRTKVTEIDISEMEAPMTRPWTAASGRECDMIVDDSDIESATKLHEKGLVNWALALERRSSGWCLNSFSAPISRSI